jgi:hypothetical protein
MRVFAIRVKLPDDVTVRCPHDPDPRVHQGIPTFGGIDQDSGGRLLRFELLVGLRQLLDISGGILQGQQWLAPRYRYRIVERCFPSPLSHWRVAM